MSISLFPTFGLPTMGIRPKQKAFSQKTSLQANSGMDQLVLSANKNRLGNPFNPAQLGQGRSGHFKTQAVLNPFVATRNPISEKEFDKLLKDLAPIAPGLNTLDKKALFKRMVLNSNQLLAEVNQLRKEGKAAQLIVYRENGQEDPEKYNFPLLGKDAQPVKTLSHINLPYAIDKAHIKSLDDLLGCIAINILFSMLLSPQIVIGGPLTVKMEKGAASANEQLKDAKFYRDAFPKSEKDFAADFAALQFSNAERGQLHPTAKVLNHNTHRNDSLRSYVSQSFGLVQDVGNALQSHQDGSTISPLKVGLVSADNDHTHHLKDVTHLFSDTSVKTV